MTGRLLGMTSGWGGRNADWKIGKVSYNYIKYQFILTDK
jgi:hypothetical protein